MATPINTTDLKSYSLPQGGFKADTAPKTANTFGFSAVAPQDDAKTSKTSLFSRQGGSGVANSDDRPGSGVTTHQGGVTAHDDGVAAGNRPKGIITQTRNGASFTPIPDDAQVYDTSSLSRPLGSARDLRDPAAATGKAPIHFGAFKDADAVTGTGGGMDGGIGDSGSVTNQGVGVDRTFGRGFAHNGRANLLRDMSQQEAARDIANIRRDPTAAQAGAKGALALMSDIARNGLPTGPGQAVLDFLPQGVAVDSPEGQTGALGAALALTQGRGTPIRALEQNPTLLAIAMPKSALKGDVAEFQAEAGQNLKDAKIEHGLNKAALNNAQQNQAQLMDFVPFVNSRITKAQELVGEAQEELGAVIAQHGAGSPQAKATRQIVGQAQENLALAQENAGALYLNLMEAGQEVRQAKFDVVDSGQQLRAAQALDTFANSIEGDQLTDGQKVQAAKINAAGYDTNANGVLGVQAVKQLIMDHLDLGDTSGAFDLFTGNPPAAEAGPASIPIDAFLKQKLSEPKDVPPAGEEDRQAG